VASLLLISMLGSADAAPINSSILQDQSLWASICILVVVVCMAFGVLSNAIRRGVVLYHFEVNQPSRNHYKRPTFWAKIWRFHRVHHRPKLKSSQLVRTFMLCAAVQLCGVSGLCGLSFFLLCWVAARGSCSDTVCVFVCFVGTCLGCIFPFLFCSFSSLYATHWRQLY